MPKQSGIYRIRGKFENRSYYSVKNGIGDVFRAINQQMSERVKTEPAFANTRAYAEEFRVVTMTTNAFKRLDGFGNINVFKPTLLSPLKSTLTNYLRNGGTGTVGQRDFVNNGWQNAVANLMMQHTRVDGTEFAGLVESCTINAILPPGRYNARATLTYKLDPTIGARFKALGYDGIQFEIYFTPLITPLYNPVIGEHSSPGVQSSVLAVGSYSFTDNPETKTETRDIQVPGLGASDGVAFRYLQVRAYPYKTSNFYYIPRSLCTAAFVPVDYHF